MSLLHIYNCFNEFFFIKCYINFNKIMLYYIIACRYVLSTTSSCHNIIVFSTLRLHILDRFDINRPPAKLCVSPLSMNHGLNIVQSISSDAHVVQNRNQFYASRVGVAWKTVTGTMTAAVCCSKRCMFIVHSGSHFWWQHRFK